MFLGTIQGVGLCIFHGLVLLLHPEQHKLEPEANKNDFKCVLISVLCFYRSAMFSPFHEDAQFGRYQHHTHLIYPQALELAL